MTVPIGLGIGRLVFRALNAAEAVFAVVLVVALVAGGPGTGVVVAAIVAAVVLAAQLGAIRPALNKRSDRVLAGEELPRSRAHLWYVATEGIKVIALAVTGVLALTIL